MRRPTISGGRAREGRLGPSLRPRPLSARPAAERAFTHHYGQVYRYLLRRTRDHHEAEDLAAEVFAAAAERLELSSAHAAPPLAWLYTVASRRFVDQVRRSHATASLDEDTFEAPAHEYGSEVATALRAGLQKLPASHARVVAARLLLGYSFAEIAADENAAEGAVRMRFVRGLRMLRDELERLGIEQ